MSATSKHTPGPWTVYANSPGNDDLPSVMAPNPSGSGLFYVAQCQNDADAHLIALAPEMLALLQRIADTPCDHGPQAFCPRDEARKLLEREAVAS
jgi:hypothetical protein